MLSGFGEPLAVLQDKNKPKHVKVSGLTLLELWLLICCRNLQIIVKPAQPGENAYTSLAKTSDAFVAASAKNSIDTIRRGASSLVTVCPIDQVRSVFNR